MAITQRRLTLAEFLELPEEKPALEYLDGVVTRKVAPQFDHGVTQGELTRLVNNMTVPRRLAIAVPELRTTYAEASLVPDVAIYRWDRVPRDESGRLRSDPLIPPDIAVEIRSPSQTRRELLAKCAWYLEHGVKVTLLFDPNRRSITVMRSGTPALVLREGDTLDLSDIVSDLILNVADLFETLGLFG